VIATYAGYRLDGLTTTVLIHLLAYSAVATCVASGLHTLFQSPRISADGAVSKPVPAMVVRNAEPLPTGGVVLPIAPVAPDNQDAAVAPIAPTEPEAETIGLPNPQPEMKPLVIAPSPSQTNNRPHRVVKPHREVRMESAKRHSAQCIPAYDSSGAQTRAC
jgi:hypothetical protein